MGGETQEKPGQSEKLENSEKICFLKCNNKSEWRQYQAEKGQTVGRGSTSCLLNKGRKASGAWKWWYSHSTRVSHSKQTMLNKTMFKGLRKSF